MERARTINICDRVTLFALYATIFFFPISKATIEIFTTLAIVFWIIKKFLQQRSPPRTYINVAIFIYLCVCLFSVFISSNPRISSRTFLGKTLQEVILFFVIVDTLNSERRIKNFLYILFFSAFVLGVDGIYQYLTHKDFIRHRLYIGKDRIHATFPTPNDFACYLYMVIPFTLSCVFVKTKFKLRRFLLVGLFTLLFACLTLTISRGGWFAFLSILLFMSIWVRPLGILLLVMGILIIISRQFYYPALRERLNNFFVFLDGSSIDRNRIWDSACRMIMHKPWFGLGVGTFMFNFDKFIVGTYIYGTPYAHNCYLQMASEVGIIGLAAFLSILVLFFTSGVEKISYHQRTFSWYALLASLAAVLGYCVQMTVDTIFYSLDLGMLFWLILGLGSAVATQLELDH